VTATGTDVAVREETGAPLPSLLDGPDPAGAVAYARQVSASIAGILEPGSGYAMIQGKKHVTIEGWQTLAAMTGHTVEVEWSRPVEGIEPADNGIHAWEARAVVRDQHGRVVSAATSMASPSEKAPWNRAEFSVRSMSETRAQSRALSSRMRYIVTLAGFSGTPSEEMPHDAPPTPDPIQLARDRFKVLVSEGFEANDISEILGDQPARLADDAFLVHTAAVLAIVRAGVPIDGEVIDGQETIDLEDIPL
jgi:hypothetical protein